MAVRFRYGTPGNDTLRGSEQKDAIFGRAGDDRLFGLGGNDRLHGEAGDDQLDAGAGDDLLEGGPGGDVLRGGPGTDVLAGGTVDRPQDTRRDHLLGGDGADQLHLAGDGAVRDKGWGEGGDDAFVFTGKGAVGYGGPGADRFLVATAGEPLSTGLAWGGPGADVAEVYSGGPGEQARLTFHDWQPGVDRLAGAVEGQPAMRFVLTFDANGDGHVTVADGSQARGQHRLAFAVDPATGKVATTLQLDDWTLYLPHADALF